MNKTTETGASMSAALLETIRALEDLLPGLVLDLRYASDDDDKDAMRSRIKTVTDALAKVADMEAKRCSTWRSDLSITRQIR